MSANQQHPVPVHAPVVPGESLAEVSVVITNNAREFLRVPGLAVEEWAIESP